uniref:Uncharacterized protein n=1 Tax=Salix viminalis TaxID=40686 RepID=A0A6N2KX70_SALVM
MLESGGFNDDLWEWAPLIRVPINNDAEVVVERVSSKATRPYPPPVAMDDHWVHGILLNCAEKGNMDLGGRISARITRMRVEDGHGSSRIETKEYSPKYIRGCGIHTALNKMSAFCNTSINIVFLRSNVCLVLIDKDPYVKNLQNRSERSCGGLLAASTGPFAAGNIIPWLIHESGLPTFD